MAPGGHNLLLIKGGVGELQTIGPPCHATFMPRYFLTYILSSQLVIKVIPIFGEVFLKYFQYNLVVLSLSCTFHT